MSQTSSHHVVAPGAPGRGLRWLALGTVVATVGALNMLVGGALAYVAMRGLKRRNVIDDTFQELSKSVAVLAADGHPRLPEVRREHRQ